MEEGTEILTDTVFLVFLAVFVGIVAMIIRAYSKKSVSKHELDFGMLPSDLEKLKESGELSEEEYKEIRSRLNKRFVERLKQEQEIQKRPEAEKYLQSAEKEVLQGQSQKESKTGAALDEEASEQNNTPMMAGRFQDLQKREKEIEESEFPDRLRVHLKKSTMELEGLQQAGFLTADDLNLIEVEKERGDQAE